MLFTVNLLGKALFRGLRDSAIGLTVTRLAVQAERHPAQASAVRLVIVAGFIVTIVTIVAVGLLTGPIRPLLPW